MNWLHLCRRTHLCLGLALLPWLSLYALSAIAFNHAERFEQADKEKGLPNWIPRFERPYDTAVPESGDLRAFGQRVLRDAGIEGTFGVYRQGPDQVNIYVYTFWKSTQLKYFIRQKRLVAEDKRFRWDHFLTGMHAKGGYQDGGLHDLWAAVIDLVCFALLVWVVTGLLMWWRMASARLWGFAALAAGWLVFAGLLRLL